MFTDRIKLMRSKKGLTQQELGNIVGVTQQAVGRWEKGLAFPDNETLLKLADFFGVTTDYLLGRDTEPTNANDLISIAIEQAEKMHKSDKEKAALEHLKAMPLDEQQRRILEKYNNLSPEQRQAIDVILHSLASSPSQK